MIAGPALLNAVFLGMRGRWSLIRIMSAADKRTFVSGMADVGGERALGGGRRHRAGPDRNPTAVEDGDGGADRRIDCGARLRGQRTAPVLQIQRLAADQGRTVRIVAQQVGRRKHSWKPV